MTSVFARARPNYTTINFARDLACAGNKPSAMRCESQEEHEHEGLQTIPVAENWKKTGKTRVKTILGVEERILLQK